MPTTGHNVDGLPDVRRAVGTVWWMKVCTGGMKLTIATRYRAPWWCFWRKDREPITFTCPLEKEAPPHFHVQCGRCGEHLRMRTASAVEFA